MRIRVSPASLVVVRIAVALVILPAAACQGGPVHRPAIVPEAKTGCPDDATLELLHRAVFFLEQGGRALEVAGDLAEVGRRTAVSGPGAAWARSLAERMESASTLEDGRRELAAEILRAELHDSACLAPEIHRRFHRWLPPAGARP